MSVTVGIDIGGSSVGAVARHQSGEIISRHEMPVRLEGGRQVAEAAIEALFALDTDDFDAVGVGVPGQVDPRSGEVRLAVNLGIGSDPFDLAGAIGSAVGRPVTIENDVRAGALGARESLALGGWHTESLCIVSIGTGISAGVISDGVLVRGSQGMAGEIGHVVVDTSGPVCRCGQHGCLEAVAAGPAIAIAWPTGDRAEAATTLFGAVASGDEVAESVARRITDYLTTALIWMAATYDSEAIVLAGGVSSAGNVFLEMMHNHIKTRASVSELAAHRLRPEQVTLADPRDPPGARGAAVLADSILQQREQAPAPMKANNQ